MSGRSSVAIYGRIGISSETMRGQQSYINSDEKRDVSLQCRAIYDDIITTEKQ